MVTGERVEVVMESMPDIVCDVDLPRDARSTGIPRSWVRDPKVSLSATGVACHVATYPAGTVVPGAELSRAWAEGDSPAAVVAELVGAGYLLPDGPSRFRLVHPARLGPMPTA